MRTSHNYFTLAKAALFVAALLVSSCDKEVTTTESDLPIYLGKIIVQSDPPGASIYINGDNTGKFTPDSIRNLESGKYNIELRMKLFLDTSITVDLHDNRGEVVYINYMNSPRNFGDIICESQPEHSLIFLDDSSTGLYTPNKLSFIWPGKHKIKITRPEHRADSTDITVYAGRENSVTMTLQDTSEVINYTPQNSAISSPSLKCVAVDQDNIVWCGGYIGLIKFAEPNWTLYNSLNSSLPATLVNTIRVDAQNRKWIGTPKGLLVIDGDVWTKYTNENSGLPINYILRIEFDSKGNVWLQATDMSTPGYLVKFDGVNWSSYQADRTFLSFAIDENDVVWVASTYGMKQLINGEWFSNYQYSTDDEINALFYTRSISQVKIEKDGTFWFAVETSFYGDCRIFSMNENVLTEHLTEFGRPKIRDLYISPNGTKFFTTHYFKWDELIKITSGGEVVVYNANTWNWPLYLFTDITANSKGDIYISSSLHGLIKFKGFAL